MQKKYRLSLFLFRRDLRLEDNPALIAALEASQHVLPAFIFTSEQLEENPYRSKRCVKFMFESLHDLKGQLEKKGGTLFFFKGKPEAIIEKCLSELKVEALYVNRDYTPYSKERDKKIEAVCKKRKVPFHSFDDALLTPPEDSLKQDGKPYTIFTPYYRHAIKRAVPKPVVNRHTHYYQGQISFSLKRPSPSPKIETLLKGGRSEGLKLLKNINPRYGALRDYPAEDSTTHLSPYLKFNVCSIRKVYSAISQLKGSEELIRSLYWRDFFTTIAFYFPHVFEGPFDRRFEKLKWSASVHNFGRWCEGTTGFPLVDAGMRELNATGFMHNRVRMLTASFLVKDLHLNWQWGEKYFAQHLIDYDPAVNNGNWQWAASTGCDRQPYFRIFNPWLQQKKFDPECHYIKKWIPELKDLPPKTVHTWYDVRKRGLKYPSPMVDHAEEAKKTLEIYSSTLKR